MNNAGIGIKQIELTQAQLSNGNAVIGSAVEFFDHGQKLAGKLVKVTQVVGTDERGDMNFIELIADVDGNRMTTYEELCTLRRAQ